MLFWSAHGKWLEVLLRQLRLLSPLGCSLCPQTILCKDYSLAGMAACLLLLRQHCNSHLWLVFPLTALVNMRTVAIIFWVFCAAEP